jgi:hypothetical protein
MLDPLGQMTKPPNHAMYVKGVHLKMWIKCLVFVSNLHCLVNKGQTIDKSQNIKKNKAQLKIFQHQPNLAKYLFLVKNGEFKLA